MDNILNFVQTSNKSNNSNVIAQYASIAIMTIVFQFFNSSDTSAQSITEIPPIVAQCEYYQNENMVPIETLGFEETLILPTSRYYQFPDGHIEFNAMFFFDPQWDIDPALIPENYYGVDLASRARPLLEMFINFSLMDQDVWTTNSFPEVIPHVEENDNLVPILMELALGLPPERARAGLERLSEYLYSHGPEGNTAVLDLATASKKTQVDFVLAHFEEYTPSNVLHDGYDVLTLEEQAEIERVDDTNWGAFKNSLDAPDLIWQYLESRYYSVQILPYSAFAEGYIGGVSGNRIQLGFREDGKMNRRIGSHEFWHIIQSLIENDLNDVITFNVTDGTTTNNFSLALATNLRYFYNNEYSDYPFFADIVSWLLIGSPSSNEELQNYITAAGGYRNLLNGNIDLLDDPVAYIEMERDYAGSDINIVNETSAMLYERLFEFCLYGDRSVVPPYIQDLFNLNNVEAAIRIKIEG